MARVSSGSASVLRKRLARCYRDAWSGEQGLAAALFDGWVLPGLALLLLACVAPTVLQLLAYSPALAFLHCAGARDWVDGGATVARMNLLTPARWCFGCGVALSLFRALSRRRAVRLATIALVGAALLWVQGPCTFWVRRLSLRDAMRRAAPLVAALDRYTADHGEGPPSLDELVPRYLPAVPTTGWACAPRYRYWPPRTTWLWHGPEQHFWRWVDFRPDGTVLRTWRANTLARPGETADAVLHRLGRPSEERFFPSWCLSLPDDVWLHTYALQPGASRAGTPWSGRTLWWDPCEWSTPSPNTRP